MPLKEIIGSDIVDTMGYYNGQDIPNCKRRFLALLDAGLSLLRQRTLELSLAEELSAKDLATTWWIASEALHPTIRENVWTFYHRRKYDTAVFEAMKAVEIAVREASGLSAADIGTGLMRKAFNAENGRLTNKSAEPAERQARSDLFAGAIGSYKNPHSHRSLALDDPDEAAEIIMLANHLLRIVDSRRADVGTP